jgi:hypothetical protein
MSSHQLLSERIMMMSISPFGHKGCLRGCVVVVGLYGNGDGGIEIRDTHNLEDYN